MKNPDKQVVGLSSSERTRAENVGAVGITGSSLIDIQPRRAVERVHSYIRIGLLRPTPGVTSAAPRVARSGGFANGGTDTGQCSV